MPKNGNDGTYFELRLIEEICRNKQLTFRFASELSRSIDLMDRSHGNAVQDKIEIQELRLKKGLFTFVSQVSQLEDHFSKKLTDIDW